ncbi:MULTISPECIES: type II toxin-antitoxin system RatA family toxin [Hyphobacterium]|uniref:Type II toxin-antitoxin system RatA family toxin n=1 Tax=Hyphobacterium vulgare TaxID=1736751 RepID=A0ABV6ZT71_9PROT
MRIRHRPEDVFELVSDVRRYPQFIKYLSALRVRKERSEGSVTFLETEAVARYRFVTERFVTAVTLDRDALGVEVKLIEGPFNTLENAWVFHRLGDGSTLVDFMIDFEFSNPLLQTLLAANKERAVHFIINAFRAEAGRRYQTVGSESYDWSADRVAQ